MKRISAHFFATEGGREPVREWILELGYPDKKTLGEDIKAIEFGWPRDYHPPNLVKHLGGKLWEVHSELSGDRIARIIFAVIGNKMLLLHAFIKKSRKTLKQDLEIAWKRLKQYERGQR